MKILNLLKNLVSRLGGVESRDYVVESGKSNGCYYRKWNSGFVELNGFAENLTITSGFVAVALPVNILTCYEHTTSLWFGEWEGRGARKWIVTSGGSTGTLSYVYLRDASGNYATGDVAISYHITGRWK